jgi:hypothetical protein
MIRSEIDHRLENLGDQIWKIVKLKRDNVGIHVAGLGNIRMEPVATRLFM